MLSFYKQFFWDRDTSAYINRVLAFWYAEHDWQELLTENLGIWAIPILCLPQLTLQLWHPLLSPQTHPILLFLVVTLLTNPHSHFYQFILLDNEESNCRLNRLATLCNQHKELKENILHITYTNTNESLIKFILYSAEKLFFPLRTATSSKKQCVEKRNSRSPTWVWTRGKLRRWHVP